MFFFLLDSRQIPLELTTHSGIQRVDGLYVASIVREPNDPNADLYDHDLPEHPIQVQDWEHDLETSIYSAGLHSDGGSERPTIPVNGNITNPSFPINFNQCYCQS